ncbi:MAG TPA: LysR family transcriptional regulator [Thermoanaerobaculia bacterium]|nr:LysR family transcriptional regulator [Thermoanaerobaculia bacterium]
MNPVHLRTFVAVAELRHFARAANACNLSQPAVSHQIAQLEADVGAKLFNRAPRRVSLTVAGEVMLEEARRVLAAVDRARERMHEVTSGAVGRIRLGATASPGLYLLPAVLTEYREAHPTFDLQFQIAPLDAIVDRVIRNDLDMAVIAGRSPTSELRTKPLARDALVAIGAPATASHGVRRALADHCWILREEGSTTRRELDAWLHRHRITPARTMVFDGPDAVKRAVTAGLGISIVSRLTVEEELASGRLIPLEVGLTLPRRDICLIDHPQKHHGAACSAMLGLFAARFENHPE